MDGVVILGAGDLFGGEDILGSRVISSRGGFLSGGVVLGGGDV